MGRGGAGETRGLLLVSLFWSSKHIESFSFQVLLYLLSGAAVAHNKRRLIVLIKSATENAVLEHSEKKPFDRAGETVRLLATSTKAMRCVLRRR